MNYFPISCNKGYNTRQITFANALLHILSMRAKRSEQIPTLSGFASSSGGVIFIDLVWDFDKKGIKTSTVTRWRS
jgi:hypothetical protein